MKYLKKLFCLLIVILLATSAVGCKKVPDNKEEPKNNDPIPLDTSLTDEFRLAGSFASKDFVRDGVGEVTLNRLVDGDTISVYSGNTSITIRFLGIDTPESTGRVEAWGKAASSFVKDKLNTAVSIVLEAESERVDSTGKRYLAWVWYKSSVNSEYRLLNLEEIELAFTKYMINDTSKYFNTMYKANEKAKKSLKKVWGETDPNFNYSRDAIETTILYMLAHPDEFQSGTKFELKVKLIRTSGNNMFLEDADEVDYDNDGVVVTGKGGIYAFSGYTVSYYHSYKIGDVFTIQCQLEFGGNYGTQLTGLAKPSRVIENVEPEIEVLDVNALVGGEDLKSYSGKVVQLNNLKVDAIKEKVTGSGDKYFVVEAKNEDGRIFDIYFGNSLITNYNVGEKLVVGKTYNIIGGVAFYEFANGEYQLSVGDAPRYSNGIVYPEDLFRVNDIVEVK
jgi:micrococcal nuclease